MVAVARGEVRATPSPAAPGGPAEKPSPAYHIVKRVLDVVAALLLLLASAPLLALIALLIKLDSRGPVFFAQERLGGRRRRTPGGRRWRIERFRLYKFRTMHAGAAQHPHRDYMTAYVRGDTARLAALRPDRHRGDSYRPARDARVTRVGAVLRRSSLDELPQLWNVVRGDMSLVGPRPPLPYEVALYGERQRGRLAGRPGLTGLAQVRGRCAIDFEETVRLDLEYLGRRSLLLDLRILLLTVPVVLTRKGAD